MTPRKKRVWTVSDFALHAYNDDSAQACRRARRYLVRLNQKHGGQILLSTVGTNREYSFHPAILARLEPDLFTAIESLEFRLDAVEEDLGDIRATQRLTILQMGHNSRDIARLQSRRPAA